MEVGKELFHDIRKCFCIMETEKENFHGMHKSSYIMEAGKEFFHDIQRNFHTMEFCEVTFHDIRGNFNIMEAHLKSISSQSRRSSRQSFQKQSVKHPVVRLKSPVYQKLGCRPPVIPESICQTPCRPSASQLITPTRPAASRQPAGSQPIN